MQPSLMIFELGTEGVKPLKRLIIVLIALGATVFLGQYLETSKETRDSVTSQDIPSSEIPSESVSSESPSTTSSVTNTDSESLLT